MNADYFNNDNNSYRYPDIINRRTFIDDVHVSIDIMHIPKQTNMKYDV